MIRRRLFNIVSAVSLLLLFATLLLPIGEQHYGMTWVGRGATDVKHMLLWGGWFITLENEGLPGPGQCAAALKQLNLQSGNSANFSWPLGSVGPEPWSSGPPRDYGILSIETGNVQFDVAARTQSYPSGIVCGSWSRLGVSIWAPMLLFSILPMVKIRRLILARSRSSPGLCAKCGYNLTGNTSGVCPECGTAVPTKPEALA